MKECTLILPHFDDEYCGCRSIVESPNWHVDRAVFITDSTTQFHPTRKPSVYYEIRLQESTRYLKRYNPHIAIRTLDFPEQLWEIDSVHYNLVSSLKGIPYSEYTFVPYFDDAHKDHRVVGQIFATQQVKPISNIVYYLVHHKKGFKLPSFLDWNNYPFKLLMTKGQKWDGHNFLNLYPSQAMQYISLQEEQYFHTEKFEL